MSEKHIINAETSQSDTELENQLLDAELEKLAEDNLECTPNEDIERIRLYEASVELIGRVDSMDAPKFVGKNGNKIFKFFVNNNSGHRLQVIAWNKEIDRIQAHVMLNQIVHIDGAMAVPSKEGFQFGTLPFELTVRSNTIVNNLGKEDTLNAPVQDEVIPILSLEEAVDSTGIIKIHGYIKNNFLWVEKYKENMDEYGVGAITDGRNKMEVRISKLDRMLQVFEKGDKVEIRGRIRYNSELWWSLDDVVLLEGPKMGLRNLLRGTAVLSRKRNVPSTSSNQQQNSSSSSIEKKKKKLK